MGHKQRISYLPLEAMDDEMRAEMERCRLLNFETSQRLEDREKAALAFSDRWLPQYSHLTERDT